MRWLIFIACLFTLILILTVAFGSPTATSSDNSLVPDPDSDNSPLPLTPLKHETDMVAAPDGTVYLVESGSGKILWSFSSGPSIYSSYQELPNHEGEKLNASAYGDNFYIDYGEDWKLHLHNGTASGKRNVTLTAEEVIKLTPFVSAGGDVMLGSKKTAVFLVDAKTGRVIRTFRSDNLIDGAEETSNLTGTEIEEWLPTSPMDTEAVEKPLCVTRTDYALKYTSTKTGKVLWYLMFADIEASFQCEGIESFFGHSLDRKLPMYRPAGPKVLHIRDRNSLESLSINDMLKDALPGGRVRSLPASDHHAMEFIGHLLAPHHSNENEIMLALPSAETEEFIIRSLPGNVAPQMSSHVESGRLAPPHFSVLYSVLVPIVMAFFVYVRRVVSRRRARLHKQSEDIKLPNVTPKKKKSRKSVVNKDNSQNGAARVSDKMGDHEIINRALPRNPSGNNGTCTVGRRIGKLIVTNKEIAKGSNGTIVLEGNYDGRSVAVKRLVQTHHNIAVKEIQNLIASDQHPNIVRWYGVEYDQNFVYISLELCACSLDELITFCKCQNHMTNKGKDHESPHLSKRMQLRRTFGSGREFELWKTNGYPSPWLVKVMRDIVHGVAHLHDLGIIHRDLKPQNVLVIKDRPISAKISDMGISKQLDGDMSSLTKHVTGYGSSGWQAPEQLRHERQTRAVDLFSLGCILFFCITGGKHPFGENLERDVNIVNNRKDLFLIDNIPEATDLISRLLDPNPDLRPKASEVLHHPFFWNPETRLSFLRDVSDRVELEDRENASELLDALESRGRVALGGKWDEKMDGAFINDIGRYRRYKYDSVRDLLRVIRNKLNHYRELSKEIQALLGSVPEGFNSYFSNRFPKLLIEVYHVILSHCAEEEIFHKYFRSSVITL